MAEPFVNESTAVRTNPSETAKRSEVIAAILLKQNRDAVRLLMNNPNLTDKEVDDIIYMREHPVAPDLVSSSIVHRDEYGRPLTNSLVSARTKQHELLVLETVNRNNGLRTFGYSLLSDKLAEQNPLLVRNLEKEAAADVTAKVGTAAALIPGMQWLRGFSAPLYYGINAGLTGASGYDWYKNGANFWNVTGTFGGGLDLAIPAVSKAYNFYGLNRAFNRALNTPRSFGAPISTEVPYSPNISKYIISNPNERLVYFGPKRSISEFVNSDGTVNVKEALKFANELADYWGGIRMANRAENPKYHQTDPNTFLHTKQAAQYAWNMSLPQGISRRDLMVSTLGHDFGKMFAGEGHGPIGADYLKLIFPDLTDEQYLAIAEHMLPTGLLSSKLGLATKRADINTGNMSPEEITLFYKLLDNKAAKYLELLGTSKEPTKFKGEITDRSQVTRPFAEYLESLGIDSSVFTEMDINMLMGMRSKSVQSSAPLKGRSAIVYESKPRNLLTIFSIDINENGNLLGEIQARSHTPNHPRANEVPVDMIERVDGILSKGLSEDAYNVAIDYIHQTNIGEGLVSGDRLLSPEITYRVWTHYPNRQLLRNHGHHSFGTGRDITGTPISETKEGPIVMLTEPSKTPVPMKSNHIFHPDMIKDGKLSSPDWTKYGIYYTLPLLLGLNGISTNKRMDY